MLSLVACRWWKVFSKVTHEGRDWQGMQAAEEFCYSERGITKAETNCLSGVVTIQIRDL